MVTGGSELRPSCSSCAWNEAGVQEDRQGQIVSLERGGCPVGTAGPCWGGSARMSLWGRCQGDPQAQLGGGTQCPALTLQRGGCADVATAVAAALVAPGTLLIEAAEVQARPCLPGDGACSHSACEGNTRWGVSHGGAPQSGPAWLWGTQLALTSGDVCADAAAASAGAPLSPGTLRVGLALLCAPTTIPVPALCRGTAIRCHAATLGG